MNKHTPGPWSVHAGRMPEIRAGSINISDIRWNGHNERYGMANAKLIAAAPDLLEVARNLHHAIMLGNVTFRTSELEATAKSMVANTLAKVDG